MPALETGPVTINYQKAGSGFPLLVLPGGGLNATIEGLADHPFNPLDTFNDTYQVITLDIRNANEGQTKGPLEIERPWDALTDDQLNLMNYLGFDQFMVMGFCIGGPMIWNLLKLMLHTRSILWSS